MGFNSGFKGLIQALKFDSSKTHNVNETVITAVQDKHSEMLNVKGKCEIMS